MENKFDAVCINDDEEEEERRIILLKKEYSFNGCEALKNQSIYTTIYRDLQHAIYNLVGNAIIGYDTEHDTYLQFYIRILEKIDWTNLKEKIQFKLTKEILDRQTDIKETMKDVKRNQLKYYQVRQLWDDLRHIICRKTNIDIQAYFFHRKIKHAGELYLFLVNVIYNILDTNSFWWSVCVEDNIIGKSGEELRVELNNAKSSLFDCLSGEEAERMKTKIEFDKYYKKNVY